MRSLLRLLKRDCCSCCPSWHITDIINILLLLFAKLSWYNTTSAKGSRILEASNMRTAAHHHNSNFFTVPTILVSIVIYFNWIKQCIINQICKKEQYHTNNTNRTDKLNQVQSLGWSSTPPRTCGGYAPPTPVTYLLSWYITILIYIFSITSIIGFPKNREGDKNNNVNGIYWQTVGPS